VANRKVKVGDLVMTTCKKTKEQVAAQVLDVKKTAYGYDKLVLLCSCGYYYHSNTMHQWEVHLG